MRNPTVFICQLLLFCSVGHANVQTDIKEAIFVGLHDDLVAAGSDDGSVFIYDAVTGQVVKILQADEDVANCVQVALLPYGFHHQRHASQESTCLLSRCQRQNDWLANYGLHL